MRKAVDIAARIAAGAAAGCVLLAGCAGGGPEGPPALEYDGSTAALVSAAPGDLLPAQAPAGMELVAQKGYTALFANLETGDVAAQDRRSGLTYFGTPPEADADEMAYGEYLSRLKSPLTATDITEDMGVEKTKNAFDGAYARQGVVAKKVEGGVQVWYQFMEEKYAIPVEYTVCEDGFRVRLYSSQIVEKGDARLYSVSLLPYFFAQKGDGEGYLLVPDGSGALIRFSSGKESYPSYTAGLYGDEYLTSEDYSGNVQQPCLLPMIGIQGAKGGVLAIADNGSADGTVYAGVNGRNSSYNNGYFSFAMRRRQSAVIGNPQAWDAKSVTLYEPGAIAAGDCSVRYVLFDSTPETGLSAMAEAARAYVAARAPEKLSAPPDSPLILSTLGGYRRRTSVMGMITTKTEPVTTIREASGLLDALEAGGVRDVTLLYKGLDRRAMDGKLEAGLKPDGSIGGKSELAALAERLGTGRLYLAYNPVVFTQNSAAANKQSDAVRDLSQNRFLLKTYRRNTFHPDNKAPDAYLLKPPLAARLLRDAAAGAARTYTGAGLLVQGYGTMLYGDYTKGGLRRIHTAQTVSRTMDEVAGQLPAACESANLFAACASSLIVDIPASSSRFDILDESVPFYQMVMTGARQVASKPLNLYGDSREAFLECVRFGMTPHYELVSAGQDELKASGLDSFYAAGYEEWNAAVREAYAQYKPVYEAVGGAAIADYRMRAPGVTETVYDNGARVLVNTAGAGATVDGRTVGAGTFVLVKP